MHVSLFDALPAHTPPEEVWDFITSEENNLQWDEQGISVPMLADTTIQYTKTMGKKLHKATTSAYNLVTSSGGKWQCLCAAALPTSGRRAAQVRHGRWHATCLEVPLQ